MIAPIIRYHNSKMICRQCLQRLARTNRARQATPAARSFSRTATRPAQAVTTQTTTATNARPEGHPAAISTSAAQPFSTPLTPTASEKDAVSANAAPTVKSSVPAGTVLRGLNFMKNQQDPVALEDSEYPPWLWTVLSKKGDADGGAAGGEGDLFCKCWVSPFLGLSASPYSFQPLGNSDQITSWVSH